jgi:hypothetical protein
MLWAKPIFIHTHTHTHTEKKLQYH